MATVSGLRDETIKLGQGALTFREVAAYLGSRRDVYGRITGTRASGGRGPGGAPTSRNSAARLAGPNLSPSTAPIILACLGQRDRGVEADEHRHLVNIEVGPIRCIEK